MSTADDSERVPGRSQPAEPCLMVIFGAMGDLTQRLVAPALYNLKRRGLLPDAFALVGVDLADGSDTSWHEHLGKGLKSFIASTESGADTHDMDTDAWTWLCDRMTYLRGDFTEAALYGQLEKQISSIDKKRHTEDNVLFYLATAPQFFDTIVARLGKAKLARETAKSGWRRVVIEKPFGHDLASAQALNKRIGKVLREDQIFRIDHFLGKETVQNILSFRFANGLFEPIWNRDRIDHIQITAAETVGVEERAKFYERTGCLRDMVPNHLFQLLALVAMEPPTSFSSESLRQRKAETISAIRPPKPEDAVRGQYRDGAVNGELARAYRDEDGVASDSDTETYVALKLAVDTWRWAGVPFYLRTGKHLGLRTTEIAIRFKSAPFAPFRSTAVDALGPNWLVLHIQPNEGISLQFDVKKPGTEVNLAPVRMDFRYRDWFMPEHSVGYETLLYDCMTGDAALFQDDAMVEAGWRAVQPILNAWQDTPPAFPNYASGSAGPALADTLLALEGGRSWRPLDSGLKPPPRRPARKGGKSAGKGKANPAKAIERKKTATQKTAEAETKRTTGKRSRKSSYRDGAK